jgi:CrcB protein
VLGGFTTFSAFALEALLLAQRGQLTVAAAYVLASVVGCLVAAAATYQLAATALR